MDTASASSLITDSAAGGSAWGGGVRVYNGRLNWGENGERFTPILQKFKQLKKAIIEATIDIDKETPWQEREPAWLTEMMDVQHRLKNNFFRR